MKLSFSVASIALLLILVVLAASQTNPQASAPQLPVEEIIRRFAAAESENKIARNNYTFTQEVDIRTLGAADSITGRYHRISDIVYDDRGERFEKITHFPMSTLTSLTITQEDLRDLAGVQPFALSSEDLSKYRS